MDRLKSTNDPRMQVYCALPDGDTARDKQKGLPNGYDLLTISSGDPTYTSLPDYSTFNPATLLLLNAPTIYMVHAEVELLQAEAILKGYISGDAKAHYENAVRSSMQQQAIYGDAGVRLTPASYQSSPNKGTIPLRFRYPTEEYSINEDNVAEAVNNQGEDKMSTAVWWDK